MVVYTILIFSEHVTMIVIKKFNVYKIFILDYQINTHTVKQTIKVDTKTSNDIIIS